MQHRENILYFVVVYRFEVNSTGFLVQNYENLGDTNIDVFFEAFKKQIKSTTIKSKNVISFVEGMCKLVLRLSFSSFTKNSRFLDHFQTITKIFTWNWVVNSSCRSMNMYIYTRCFCIFHACCTLTWAYSTYATIWCVRTRNRLRNSWTICSKWADASVAFYKLPLKKLVSASKNSFTIRTCLTF